MKTAWKNAKITRFTCACCFIVVILPSLSGCFFESNDDLLHYIESIKKRTYTRKIPPIPAMPAVEDFVFPENDMRRNPFQVAVTNKIKDGIAPDTLRKRQALEAYSLDALQFSGILEQGNTIWALIKIPGEASQIVRIKVGDYMGKNFGRVVKITDKKITLEELYQVEGRWIKRETSIMLHGSV